MAEIAQPVLDDVPAFVRREMPEPDSTMLKEQQYGDLLQWLKDNADDTVAITATGIAPKVNLLGTLGSVRPAWGNDAHRACAEIIVKIFYLAGLINLKLGKSDETALLKACCHANYEMASMLLEYGSGQAPLCYSLVFYPECVPWREGMHCEAGDCGGEGWRLSGGARMADRRGATR